MVMGLLAAGKAAKILQSALQGAVDAFKEGARFVGDKVVDFLNWIKDVGAKFDEKVVQPIQAWLGPLEPLVDGIKAAIGAMFDVLIAVFNGDAFQAIKDFFTWIGEVTVGDVFGSLIAVYDATVKPILDYFFGLLDIEVDLVEMLKGALPGPFARLFDSFDLILASDIDLGELLKGALAAPFIKLFDGFEFIGGLTVDLGKMLLGALSWPFKKLFEGFEFIGGLTVDLANILIGFLPEPVKKLFDGFDLLLNTPGVDLGAMIYGELPAPMQKLIDFFESVFGLFDGEGDIMGELGNVLWDLLELAVSPIMSVVDLIGDTIGAIVNFKLPLIDKSLAELVGSVNIPFMAEGGIVNTPTLAMIGEAGPEAVVPLNSQGRGMAGGNSTFNMTFNMSGITDRTDKRRLAQEMSQLIRAELRRDVGSTAIRGGLA